MGKMKAILRNPVLLATQGFLVGAFLLWGNPQVLQQTIEAPPAAASVQIVPPVS